MRDKRIIVTGKPSPASPRLVAHHLLAAAVLTYFGQEVCPFIACLSHRETGLLVTLALSGAFLAGLILSLNIRSSTPTRQPERIFWSVAGLFLAAGLSVALANKIRHGFPMVSGLKMTAGFATLGFFAALDLALERERQLLRRAFPGGNRPPPLEKVSFSLTRRFLLLATAGILLITADFLLLVTHDIIWIAMAGEGNIGIAKRQVAFEISFVAAIILAHSLNLVLSWVMNLRRFLANETHILDRVRDGALDTYVPIASHDEFGLIADRTNRMIDGLREKKRLRDIFGKVVSPEIAERLLGGEHGHRLGGERRTVTVLLADVRGFTSFTEKAEPENVVSDLNAWLTEAVRIIQDNDGIVDKFIGDGILGVFGFAGSSDGPDDAVAAGRELLAAAARLRPTLSLPLTVGVGIHRGAVIAGNIGAPDRIEFTFIGDAVNTAARLEKLTKALGVPLLISSSVHEALAKEHKAMAWRDYGEQVLTGKSLPVRVYGFAGED